MLKKVGLAAGALALVGAPIALQASERAIAPVEGEQNLGTNALLGVIAAGVLAAFIIITATDDDEPASP